MWCYAARVVRVVDGDTVDCVVDLGFRVSIQLRLRLAGCNAPELRDPAGQAAADWARGWVAENGSDVTIETQPAPEKFGRWLASVRSSGGRDLVADLIAAGHAVSWDGRGRRP